MLHLYYWIRDHLLFPRDACRKRIVQRSPKVKLLFIHDFGLTLGIALIFIAMAFWHGRLGLFTSIAIFISFVFFTRYLSFLLLTTCFALSILFIFTGGELGPEFWPSIKQISAWYIAGYISGFAFAMFYNAFLFLSLKLVHCCRKNIFSAVFAYKEAEKINIIKSPIDGSEVSIPPSRFYKKLYEFNKINQSQMPHPYTIAFIANPFYKLRTGNNISDFEVCVDPIIQNLDLFIHGIDRALYSFERDPVLGRPEIWSKVKIIALFPENFDKEIAKVEQKKYSLAGRICENVQIDYRALDNLMAIDENFDDNFKRVLVKLGATEFFTDKVNKEERSLVDVIYVLSANADYTRSTALFSEGIINKPALKTAYKTAENGQESLRVHEHYAKSPGKVALNLLTARQKTFIHEFAHAMSHFDNGAIVDEYFNELKIVNDVIASGGSALAPDVLKELKDFASYTRPIFTINKRKKNNVQDPVPKTFRHYNDVSYFSDRDHPSAEEDWTHFFPLRESLHIGCSMDRTIGQHKFDKLLSDFMYERLMTKINRK